MDRRIGIPIVTSQGTGAESIMEPTTEPWWQDGVDGCDYSSKEDFDWAVFPCKGAMPNALQDENYYCEIWIPVKKK